MHTFLDSKAMAKALRKALAERAIEVSHSDSLELVARQFGLDNWNMLAARIEGAAVSDADLPSGWKVHHHAPYPLHRIGRDPDDPRAIKIVSVASSDVIGANHATLMQSIEAADYRGQTLRFTAELKGEDLDQGTIWMRIDPRGGGPAIRFDNMLVRASDGALTGTVGWTERSIVLDVPEDAGSIHYGPMLKGVGRLWARHLRLDAVPPGTMTTDTRRDPRRPSNLDFGDGA
jgi:hypothetical protein